MAVVVAKVQSTGGPGEDPGAGVVTLHVQRNPDLVRGAFPHMHDEHRGVTEEEVPRRGMDDPPLEGLPAVLGQVRQERLVNIHRFVHAAAGEKGREWKEEKDSPANSSDSRFGVEVGQAEGRFGSVQSHAPRWSLTRIPVTFLLAARGIPRLPAT
jgi:hypothetical protein